MGPIMCLDGAGCETQKFQHAYCNAIQIAGQIQIVKETTFVPADPRLFPNDLPGNRQFRPSRRSFGENRWYPRLPNRFIEALDSLVDNLGLIFQQQVNFRQQFVSHLDRLPSRRIVTCGDDADQ